MKVSGKKPLSVRVGLIAATGVGVAELGHRQATGVAAALQGVDSALDDIGVAWNPVFRGASGQTVVRQTVEAALIGVHTAEPAVGDGESVGYAAP